MSSLAIGLAAGILIALPVGAVCGVLAYFWVLAEADKQGGIGATIVNQSRRGY